MRKEGGEEQIVEGYWLKGREVGIRSANALSEGARQQENGRERRHPLDTEESLLLSLRVSKGCHYTIYTAKIIIFFVLFSIKNILKVNMKLKCILLMQFLSYCE